MPMTTAETDSLQQDPDRRASLVSVRPCDTAPPTLTATEVAFLDALVEIGIERFLTSRMQPVAEVSDVACGVVRPLLDGQAE